jgi:hypothetical protein
MNPPALARALLTAAAGEAHADFVAGDLHVEFLCLCAARGRKEGNRWYARQVLRSLPGLLQLRIRSGELTCLFVSAWSVAMPLLLLDRLWCFVYSQIPLKDGLGRAPGFLAANALIVCICAALAGATGPGPRSAVAIAAAVMAGVAFGLWQSVGVAPLAYIGVVLLAAPACSLAGLVKRRRV